MTIDFLTISRRLYFSKERVIEVLEVDSYDYTFCSSPFAKLKGGKERSPLTKEYVLFTFKWVSPSQYTIL